MILEKLCAIQQELSVPKNQHNSFGKYNYRSCEDIFQAVKPLLGKHGVALVVKDELVNMGDRFYIKATALLYDITDGNENVSTTAYAREEESKKGMDASQVTGTASSYARKYALNGLFALDDNKDADTDEYANQTKAQPTKAETTEKKVVQPTKLLCSGCKTEISKAEFDYSANKCNGLHLCRKCQKEFFDGQKRVAKEGAVKEIPEQGELPF